MINYTFIIPHRNIPDLLKRCIDSIPERDDVQIVIVDDNSESDVEASDKFPGYGRKNTDVVSVKKHRGAGYARNQGLSIARGKYVLFADADDFFSDDIGMLLDEYVNRDFDIAYFNYGVVLSDKPNVSNTHRNFRKSVDFRSDRKKLEDYFRFELGVPWAKIISLSLIRRHGILFDECMKHNDTMFSLQTGYYARNILMDDRLLYYNTYREGSITTNRIHQDDYVSQVLDVAVRYHRFSKEHDIRINKWNISMSVETLLRRDGIMYLPRVLSALRENGFLWNFILTLPAYIVHRMCKVLGVKTKYLF